MSTITKVETAEFQQVQGIISLHRSHALQTVNNENLLAAWEIGAFVSARLMQSIIQPLAGQFPRFLELTTLTNHYTKDNLFPRKYYSAHWKSLHNF